MPCGFFEPPSGRQSSQQAPTPLQQEPQQPQPPHPFQFSFNAGSLFNQDISSLFANCFSATFPNGVTADPCRLANAYKRPYGYHDNADPEQVKAVAPLSTTTIPLGSLKAPQVKANRATSKF